MKETIIELVNDKKFIEIRKKLENMNVVDIATLLEDIEKDTNTEVLLLIFRLIPKYLAAEVFAYFSLDEQQNIIEKISEKEVSQIMNALYLDDTVDFLEEMPANVVRKVLRNIDSQTRKEINQLFNYPEDSAGSLMTPEFVDLKKEMTIKQALRRIRKIGVDKETIDICYIMDDTRKLIGLISIEDIILSDEDTKLKDIMDTNIVFVNTMQDQEEVAEVFKKYGFTAIPVVDNEEKLVGIITVDDIIDVIVEEATEDIEKMAALMPSDRDYLNMSPFELAKNRVFWLILLMFTSTISEKIIANNQEIIATSIALTSFTPMLMNTGGNTGSQASTLIIRGIALNQIKLKDIFKILRKEFLVALIVGMVLAVVTFIRLLIYDKVSYEINMVVTLSIIITVINSKLIGGILPVIAKALKMDPAVMATPIITTIVDALALTSYFTIAKIILM